MNFIRESGYRAPEAVDPQTGFREQLGLGKTALVGRKVIGIFSRDPLHTQDEAHRQELDEHREELKRIEEERKAKSLEHTTTEFSD